MGRIIEPFLVNAPRNPPRKYKRNHMGMMTVMNPPSSKREINRIGKKLNRGSKSIVKNIDFVCKVYLEAGLDHSDSEHQTRRLVKDLLDHYFRIY